MLSLGTLIGGQKVGFLKKFRLTKTYYSAIWNHLLHGLVSSQTIIMLANPTMIKKINAREKNTSFSQVKDSNIHHSLDT
ncbi:hypothetical protein DHBDCA_p1029 [Dehalobacter sp. DCA]|nr:hypothetical protein DHBDCA_p1029 [Dehalobacter sp. DCA]AFV05090.1 hypothetical protein DCF50_p1085 [Dehalobacter sp. CF]